MIVGREHPFGRKRDGNVLLRLAGGYPCRLSDRCQISHAVYYSDFLATDMKEEFRFKRKTAGKRAVFLQDNARPHTAKITMETLRKMKWNILTHPSYSSDLAQNVFTCSEAQIRLAWHAVCGLLGSGYTVNHKPFF